jgi:transcription antitermination factor NusA-like protein
VVTVRGPKDDVEKCCRYLTEIHNELKENSYQLKVAVFPQCYKHLLGKNGQNIRQIKEETKTWIDLPPIDDRKTKAEAEVLVITGKKQNCEAARDKILTLQNSMADVVEVDVMIPNKIHNLLIGAGGKLVQSISEDCGGVQIRFPEAKAKSDRVTLTGLKEDVEKARTTLLEMSREKEENSYTETIEAKPQNHRFLIGKNGSNIRRIRDATGARVLFPYENDASQDIITIIGKKAGVLEAKKQLVEMLKELDKVIESEVHVDPKYHRHFVLRRGEVLRQISDELGGVSISFPKAGTNLTRVSVKGAPECVEAAKKRLLAIVEELEQRITIDVHIEQKHHRTIMGARGSKVQNIQGEFNVDIKFPERYDESAEQHEAGRNGDGVKFSDIIHVSGKPESCELAKQALLDQVPVIVEVDVPFDMHRFIIGSKGKDVRELMSKYDVHITVPPSDRESDTIQILGSPKNAAAAKEALLAIREEREIEKRNKELKSYEIKIQVDPEYHPKIIGHKGSVISKIRDKYDVNIQLPKPDQPDADIIKITGFEDKANAAKDEILALVKELCDKVKEEVEIDHRVHSRIIGARGKIVRQIMTDYEVDIRFPRPADANPNLVVISGSNADKVFDAKEHLLNLEEEHLQDVSENEYLQGFVRSSHQDKQKGAVEKQANGFVVKGAPWEHSAPDTQSNEEFPSFGNGVAAAPNSKPISSAWGARKHF